MLIQKFKRFDFKVENFLFWGWRRDIQLNNIKDDDIWKIKIYWNDIWKRDIL